MSRKGGWRLKLRRVINGAKVVTSWGKWTKGDKPMPKAAYPLSKNAFTIAKAYTWRVIEFECLGKKFRLLIAFRLDLNRYQSHLGMVVGNDTLTLARYEFHAGEPGWHMHCRCDDTGAVPGTMKCSDRRFPDPNSFHRQMDFGTVDEVTAFERAVSVFRLRKAKRPDFDLKMTDGRA